MANYMAKTLKIKTVYILDDSGAYGVGIADAFQGQVEKNGVKVLGRDRLDPKAVDYASVLTKIKALNPDALYYGGVGQAGVKLVKQSYEIVPNMIKAGGDGVYSTDILKGAGFPAFDNWYSTQASPHVTEDKASEVFTTRFFQRFGSHPDDYAVTCYTAAQVIIQAAKNIVATGKEPTRDAMQAAIQTVSLKGSLIGTVEFDANGDMKNKVISVFQVKKNAAKPLDDTESQFKYVGVAPMS